MVRREDVESMERRLRQMEAKNQALSKQLQEARRAQTAAGERVVGRVQTDTPDDLADTNDDAPMSEAANDNEVAKQVFSLSLNAGGQKQFLGSASGAILANLLGIHGQNGHHGVGENEDEPLFRRFATGSGHRRDSLEPAQQDLLLPEQLARSLLAAYLSHDHLCYPYLHPRKLIDTVSAMYSEDHYYDTHQVEGFTMDMIFAIATAQVHKFSWQVMPDAETHYERAISKLGRVLESGGLVALQSIMLLCQYRMLSVSYSTSASLWHLLGMAVRLGLELGLHREGVYGISTGLPTLAEEQLKQDIDIKRRCFWCLFGMDRVVSNTLGRPLAMNLDEIDTEYPSIEDTEEPSAVSSPTVEDILQYPQWPANTAIFNHITWHRVITGKILSQLHNIPKSRMPDAQTCMNIRQRLADELDQWKAGVESLPLTDPQTGKPYVTSTFTSPDWYRLLYYNCILMLYRPINSLHDVPQTSEILEKVYHSARQSIQSYSSLHKARRINYTWITLHAVFCVGLSYIHALRTHFQNKRRLKNSLAEGVSPASEALLKTDPTITQIVADTRACSTVLVALSERWNTARDCHEVFGRLSDAVLADASDFYITSAQSVRPATQEVPDDPSFRLSDAMPFVEPSANHFSLSQPAEVTINYQDCFEELQEFFGNHYGDNATLLPPFDWNFPM